MIVSCEMRLSECGSMSPGSVWREIGFDGSLMGLEVAESELMEDN